MCSQPYSSADSAALVKIVKTGASQKKKKYFGITLNTFNIFELHYMLMKILVQKFPFLQSTQSQQAKVY